jgi:NADH:ubiquinone oxidoreductase subunit 4 (subunit M)
MYINPAREQRQIAISGSLKLAIIICIAFVVGMGVFPNPFVEATSEAARHFFAIIDASSITIN